MANLLGQNIGTNYKGILNLNTLNGNLTTTLEAITDGDGNASTLLLSTTLARVSSNLTIGGSTTASARLHVRGDGTNPVSRFESSAGNSFFIINNSGQSLFGSAGANEPYLVNYNGTNTESGSGQSLRIRQRANTGATGNTLIQYWADGLFSGTTSGTAVSHEFLSSGFLGSSAGSANYRNATFAYTINNSGAQTGTATGIFLNATETALNGMGHNLMDLQRDGVSQFRISRIGDTQTRNRFVFIPNSDYLEGSHNTGFTTLSSAQNIQLIAGSSFIFRFLSTGIINLGGGTNAFPAIKRNGAAIDFRLADDSGFCTINTLDINTRIVSGNTSSGLILRPDGGGISGRTSSLESFTSGLGWTQSFLTENGKDYGIMSRGAIVGASTLVACAILQADSTSKGFLPPRMTTAQRDLIGTPAAGLMIYNTSTNRPNFYDGSAWVAL